MNNDLNKQVTVIEDTSLISVKMDTVVVVCELFIYVWSVVIADRYCGF